MFIFWGTRGQEHKLGYAAEFCPVCRKITPFQASVVSRVSHLYGIPMGSGDLLGHTGACQVCGTRIVLNGADYRGFVKEAGSDVEALIRQTFPEIRAQRGGRLEVEERLRRGTLHPAERAALIRETFQLFADMAEANFAGNTQIRGRGGWGCLGTIVLCIGIAVVGSRLATSPGQEEHLLLAVGVIAALGVISSLVLLILEPGRIFIRDIFPNFVAALVPLRPTRDELTEILARFKMAGFRIGKKVKPEVLSKALEAQPGYPGPLPLSENATDHSGLAGEAGSLVEASLTQTSIPPPLPGQRATHLDEAALAAGERSARMMETFQLFAELTQRTFGGGIHIRGRGGWGCLSTLLLCIAVGWAGAKLAGSREGEDHLVQIIAVIAVAGGVYSFVLLLLEPGRILDRKIFPELVAALLPFQPTLEEIAGILSRFRAAGFKIGTRVHPERLWQAIEAQRVPAAPPPLPESESQDLY